MSVADAMQNLADLLTGSPAVTEPVVTDARNLNVPCVLISPPQIAPDSVLCDRDKLTFDIWCVGTPGGWAEFQRLSVLVAGVLESLDGYVSANPASYVPLNASSAAEPCQAYRITYQTYEEI